MTGYKATAIPTGDATTSHVRVRLASLLGGRASLALGGVVGQSANSLSNLVVAVLVARMLGLAALGEYAFVFSLLLTFVAMQTGWVGDSLVVLGRGEAKLRRGISLTQVLFCGFGGITGGAILALGRGPTGDAALAFGVLVVLWQLEEYTRRALMARLAYWRQALCDASYGLVAATSLLASATMGERDLSTALWCMCLGAAVATVLGFVAISPEDRLRPSDLRGSPREKWESLRAVASFGGWRAAQMGASQGTQTLVRVLVLWMASSAALGTLEAARLVTAPLFMLLTASTNMTLPLFTRARARGVASLARIVRWFSLALAAVAVIYGGAVLILAAAATHLLVGADKPVARMAIAAWVVAGVAWGYSNSFAEATLASGASAEIFRLRLAGCMLTVVCALGALLLGTSPSFVPASVAAGALFAATLIRRRSRRYLSPDPSLALSGVR